MGIGVVKCICNVHIGVETIEYLFFEQVGYFGTFKVNFLSQKVWKDAHRFYLN